MSVYKKRGDFKPLTVKSLAKVDDWLPSKTGTMIIRLVNANNGVIYIDNRNEQLRIVYPTITLDANDPTESLGFILDKEKGWFVCGFKVYKNMNKQTVLKSIIKEIGFKKSYPLTSLMFRALKNSPSADNAKVAIDCLKLMLNWTVDDKETGLKAA